MRLWFVKQAIYKLIDNKDVALSIYKIYQQYIWFSTLLPKISSNLVRLRVSSLFRKEYNDIACKNEYTTYLCYCCSHNITYQNDYLGDIMIISYHKSPLDGYIYPYNEGSLCYECFNDLTH